MDTIPQDIPLGKHYVYTLAYPTGIVFYVGKGTGRKRIYEHEREARKGVKSHKCNAIRKVWANGEQIIRKKIAFFETDEEACMYEIALIFFMDGLTNLTPGGDGTAGLAQSPSEETRQKISAKLKGRKLPEETRQKMMGRVPASKGKPTRKRTEDEIRRSAEAHRGLKRSEATKAKMRDARLGKKASEETRAKLCIARNRRTDKVNWTEEMRLQASESMKKVWTQRKQNAPIIQLQIELFNE